MMNRGYVWAASAFAMWGILPLYWQVIGHVPADQIVAHRIVWSCLWLIPMVILGGQAESLRQAIRQPRVVMMLALAACFVCINWLAFIWAVTHQRVVESSLGYFINPLFSVLVGVFVFQESLRLRQWIGLAIATLGLVFIAWQYGRIPSIALILASSFCVYGILKKKTSQPPLVSLSIEAGFLLLPSIAYLIWCDRLGASPFLRDSWATDLILIGGGLATTIPLLCFAAGAQQIPLSAVGMLQYIGPTIQFLLGVLVNREPFDGWKAIGFACVWIACLLYAWDNLSQRPTSKG